MARTDLPVVLAVAAAISWIVLLAVGADGAVWVIMGALALAATVTGWRAGGTARAATVVGALLFVVFLGFIVADLAA